MTRLRNVRIGDKFVLSNELGVWKKVTSNRARCVFGPDGLFGTESDTNPNATAFVVPGEPMRPNRDIPDRDINDGLVAVFLVDTDDKLVHKMRVPESWAAIAAVSERIRVRLADKKEPIGLSVLDSGFDFVDGSLRLEVRE